MKKCIRTLLAILAAFLVASCTGKDLMTVFVGTYSDGFFAYDFDGKAGRFVGEGPVAKAEMPNPSYLAVRGNKVYAVSEMPDSTASVWAWRWGGNGFELLNSQPTGLPRGGEDPCYVSTDGNLLAVANYSGGTVGVYRLRGDGSIAPLDSLLFTGIGGPDLSRQRRPHAHCAVFTPDGKHLLFSEFSADEIGRLDVYAGGVRNYCKAASLHPDYGPRHLLFDASGKHLYVIGELSGDITVFDYDGGVLTEKQVIRADLLDARGAADIHISPDGRFLYASLRLKGDGLAIFDVSDDGTLTLLGHQPTGPHPRNFNITPDGRWLLVCCRDSDEVEVYSVDRKTGLLTDTGARLSAPRPVYVGW